MTVNNNEMDKPKNRIKEVLDEHGIKQTWLADRLNKSFCMVNSYRTAITFQATARG